MKNLVEKILGNMCIWNQDKYVEFIKIIMMV